MKHALRFGAEVEVALSPDPKKLDDLARRLAPDLRDQLGERVRLVSPEVFAQLAPLPPVTGVIAIARRPAVDAAELLHGSSAAPLILLENPSDFGNLGAAVRVAAAAGARAVLATGRHDPWHPAALRGSAGLHFALPVARIEALPETARPIVALSPEGEPLDPGAIPGGAILAFGSERGGLPGALLERAALRIAIPMREGVSSLNLATAVAVVLYLWRLGAHAGRIASCPAGKSSPADRTRP